MIFFLLNTNLKLCLWCCLWLCLWFNCNIKSIQCTKMNCYHDCHSPNKSCIKHSAVLNLLTRSWNKKVLMEQTHTSKVTNILSYELTCFSAWSAGHPWTCFIRFSLKCAANVGVNEHVGRADAFCGVAVFDAFVLEVWFGPGDGLLWVL